MKNIQIKGMQGSGKSTVGRELAKRGYRVVEADDIGRWININTDKVVPHDPPFTDDWLDEHVWEWDSTRMKKILANRDDVVFVVGDADNSKEFKFDQIIAIYVGNETMKRRLKNRNASRWGMSQDTPELTRYLLWNKAILNRYKEEGVVIVNGDQPTKNVADEILVKVL